MTDRPQSRDPRDALARLSANAFFGRAPLLGAARAALNAVSDGRGHAFLFVGEAGIGKTRIADELVARAQAEGVRPIQETADRYMPFEALTALLRTAAREAPLLVVDDDIHWSDPASVLLARYATRELRRDPVVCQNSDDRLSGPLFVVVQDPNQPFMSDDGGIHVDHAFRHLDQLIVESLMIPFKVIMLGVFIHSVA